MTTPEVSPAVRRAGEAMEDAAFRLLGRDLGTFSRDRIAREGLAAALDVEEMARAADPKAFEEHPIELRSQVAALQWAVRRKIAADHARAIRATILGADQ